MSLNLCKDTKYGIESKYEIRADSVDVNGICTAFIDESLVSCKLIPNTRCLTFKVTNVNGSNDYATWVWANESNNWTCNIVMKTGYIPNVGYCVFQSVDLPNGDLIRPAGIVKVSLTQFAVGFFSQQSGLLQQVGFKIIIVGVFP